MNHGSLQAYGSWWAVLGNSALFILLALTFVLPRSGRDWQSFGAFSVFIVAVFTEMYGYPFTVVLLPKWLGFELAGLKPVSHDYEHPWYSWLGLEGEPHRNPVHLLSDAVIAAGFVLLALASSVLSFARRRGELAKSGLYRRVRHPQYAALVTIMLGFLLQWPTLPTMVMFPLLAVMYVRRAEYEEREAANRFGDCWRAYALNTPRWFPKLRIQERH